MNFKLARQIVVGPNITELISKEIKRQKVRVLPISKEDLKPLAEILDAIKKHGLPKYLVRKKLPSDLGHGIFLHPQSEPILKGQLIAPYAGEVSILPQNEPDDSAYAFATIADFHLSKQEQTLLDKNHKYHPRRLYFVNVDAAKRGNFTRFINHSVNPNVIAHFMKIPKNPHDLEPMPLEIIYYAKKKILPGEQLLVCYEDGEKSYWGALDIKPFPMTPKTFQLSPSLKIIQP